MSEILTCAVSALGSFLQSRGPRNLEVQRVARILCVLGRSGCSMRPSALRDAQNYVLASQHRDGGWADPEQTAWAIATLKNGEGSGETVIPSAMRWLDSARHSGGGWGRHTRDQARIPITSLISVLVPDAVKREDKEWLLGEWQRDFNGPVRLSYKAGFFLLAMCEIQENELVTQTVAHLSEDQNEDGGFGPWKNHPIGSDPWSTGIVLLGLLSYPSLIDRRVIERAVNWFAETQLPNGLWPYHYIEEGSAYAYWGLVEALKYLAKEAQ